jgi:orotate phosphoribosyltransferase
MIESTWNGDFVFRELNIPQPVNGKGFEKLFGLALRKNKKRAHLIVSKILGKYIPQHPHIIFAAATALAEQIMHHELYPELDVNVTRRAARQKLIDCIDGNNAFGEKDFGAPSPFPFVTVFGYAEAATSLGAIVANELSASYVHSTRYPVAGATEYGSFEEKHSHATKHYIIPQDVMMLDNPENRIILVDDELTTGRTAMNTIRMFEQRTHHDVYYIATLTDLRTEADFEKFVEFQKEMGIEMRVVSLLSMELNIPEDSVEKATPVISKIKETGEPDLLFGNECHVVIKPFAPVPKNLSLGATVEDMISMEQQAQKLLEVVTPVTDEKVLVLGIEENMYFPLLFSRELQKTTAQKSVFFSSATRSPVVAHFDDSYAVKDRIKYVVPGDETPRYLYNIGAGYDRIIIITNGKQETEKLDDLLNKLTLRTNGIEVLEARTHINNLAEPLSGPEFGSYAKDDVLWLLKDLSTVSLEISLEEREKKNQGGTSAYAESLPMESSPSPQYQQLFEDSLDMNKGKIAESIAFVSEQIFALKSRKPVLVSLARAGTPIGILMRRYLQKAYNYDAPHYAISIIRGPGVDYNALKYIAAHHDPADVMFVDGWTGKGTITHELKKSVDAFAALTGIAFSSELAVLADPGSCVSIYGTRDDYLVPSACLNATVSGLISRTILNLDHVSENDYHGAKFYEEFRDSDVSNLLIDTIAEQFTEQLFARVREALVGYVPGAPDWSGWEAVEKISQDYGINNVNWVKPGVGETTRVLLRRVPWKILMRPESRKDLQHILFLAEQRNVEVEYNDDLPYDCVGLINPKATNINKDDN